MFPEMARRKLYLTINLKGEISESPARISLFAASPQIFLNSLLEALEKAAQDSRIRTVLLIIQDISLGWAQIEEIHTGLHALRSAGKELVAYLEKASNKTFYLACGADSIFLAPPVTLELVGLRGEVLFFRNLLSFAGIQPQLFSVGAFKSAAEIFTRSQMSESSRQMSNWLLRDIQERICRRIAECRGVSHQQVRKWIDGGPYCARQAVAEKLVDGVLYRDELEARLQKNFPGIRPLDWTKLRTGEGVLKRILTFRRAQIAYLVAEGMITTGASRAGRGRWPLLGSDTLVEFLQDARRKKRIKAIVLRINSPGGSGVASDLIWREVVRTARAKPLVISFGNVAASGGYYIAAVGAHIFAGPSSLTGSIGVIGGKFHIENLLKMAGVTHEAVEMGRNSGYSSPTRAFSDEQAARVRSHLEEFYTHLFLNKVAAARKKDVEEIRPSAEGRVWTGSQARERGLIDQLGGVREAIETARREAGLAQRKFRLVAYRKRPGLRDLIPAPFGFAASVEPFLTLLPWDLEIE